MFDSRDTKRQCYDQGRKDRNEEVIKILEDNWLRGSVARRVIDEIIEQLKEQKNESNT